MGAASPTRGDSENEDFESAFRCTRMAWPSDGQNSLFMKDAREEDSYFSQDGGGLGLSDGTGTVRPLPNP